MLPVGRYCGAACGGDGGVLSAAKSLERRPQEAGAAGLRRHQQATVSMRAGMMASKSIQFIGLHQKLRSPTVAGAASMRAMNSRVKAAMHAWGESGARVG